MTPLESLFADHQGGHTDFQMDSFITVRSGGTLYGCYRQALRELWKRFRGLIDLRMRRDLLAVEIDRAEWNAENSPNEFVRRTARIQFDGKRRSAIEMEKSLHDTEREFVRFYAQAASLRAALGITDETPLTEERRSQLDSEMWAHNLRAMLAVDLLTGGRPAGNTIQLVHSIPVPLRKDMIASISSPEERDRLVNWYLTYSPELPPTIELSPEETRNLLQCSESLPSPKPLRNLSYTTGGHPASGTIEPDLWPAKAALTGKV